MKPRDPAKEQSLLDAALQVADREGLEALTIQKVAREARLAVGTVYVYFEGKEELLRKLYLRSKAAAGARLFQGFSTDLPFRQAFRLICRNQFHFFVENRVEARFLGLFYRSGLSDVRTAAVSQSFTNPLLALVLRAQTEDLVVPGDPSLLIRFVLAVLREAATEAGDMDPEHRGVIADRAVAFCLAGISP